MAFVNMAKTIIVRVALLIHGLIIKVYISSYTSINYHWLFTIFDLALVIDGMVIVYKRRGREWTWFYPSFLFYLISVLPEVWIMQIHENKILQRISNERGKVDDLESFIHTLVRGSPIYLLFMGRWFLSSTKELRLDFTNYLFINFTITADIMQFSNLLLLSGVMRDLTLTCSLLFVWTMSLVQFAVTLTFIEKGEKVVELGPDSATSTATVCSVGEITRTIAFVMFQDVPFLVVRCYILSNHKSASYSLIFFVVKNIVAILLVTYVLIATLVADDDGHRESDGESKTEEDI